MRVNALHNSDRLESMHKQMICGAAIGFTKGCLIALTTGAYLNWRYNRGQNTVYFRTPYKVWYMVVWGVIGTTFATENTKKNIIHDLAFEENIRRNQYVRENLGEEELLDGQ